MNINFNIQLNNKIMQINFNKPNKPAIKKFCNKHSPTLTIPTTILHRTIIVHVCIVVVIEINK